jgi:hypothetical protein
MRYTKIIAVYCGRRAEHGNTLWAQNAGGVNGKADGIYSYCCVVSVKCSVLGRVVTQTVVHGLPRRKAGFYPRKVYMNICWKN